MSKKAQKASKQAKTKALKEVASGTPKVPALPAYTLTERLIAAPGQEWRMDPSTPGVLRLYDEYNEEIGYKDELGRYYKLTTPKDVTAYCPPETVDLVIQGVSENKMLSVICRETGITMRQMRYWLRHNQYFQERYQDALWAQGHYAWENADNIARELAAGVPHKPTADSMAKALDYYTSTRDKLLKDEFAVKTKHEEKRDTSVTIQFQSQAEYTDEDRARIAKEVGEL